MFEIFWDCLGLPGTFSGTLWDCLGLSGTIWDSLGLSWSLWDSLVLSRTVWDSLGLPWTLMVSLGLSGTVWDYLGLYRSVWECLGVSGTLCGTFLGSLGLLVDPLGLFGFTYNSCKHSNLHAGWIGLDWIYLRTLLLLEHLAVLIIHSCMIRYYAVIIPKTPQNAAVHV